MAEAIAPEINRCAVALSATLGLSPRKEDEVSLKALEPSNVEPEYRGTVLLEHYYIRAHQLANRLKEEETWKEPEIYHDIDTARVRVAGRRGIIFAEDADLRWFARDSRGKARVRTRTGDHIDLWNGAHFGSDTYRFPTQARAIWFWELPK